MVISGMVGSSVGGGRQWKVAGSSVGSWGYQWIGGHQRDGGFIRGWGVISAAVGVISEMVPEIHQHVAEIHHKKTNPIVFRRLSVPFQQHVSVSVCEARGRDGWLACRSVHHSAHHVAMWRTPCARGDSISPISSLR